MSFQVKLGKDCKLYRNKGTYADPDWSEVDLVQDLTLALTKGEADATTRGYGSWEAVVAALKQGTVDFGLLWNPADEHFAAFLNSFLNDSTVEVLILDGPVSGTGSAGNQGLRVTVQVFNFRRNEQLRNTVAAEVTIKPTYAENAPAWYTVS